MNLSIVIEKCVPHLLCTDHLYIAIWVHMLEDAMVIF